MPLNKNNSKKSTVKTLNFLKPLLKIKINGFKNSSGRNSEGKITSSHKGGGHKKKYRKIEFFRKTDVIGIVSTIEYDPNRNCNIAAVYDILKRNYFYILAPKGLNIGDIVKSGQEARSKKGHALMLSEISIGTLIHSISAKTFKKSQISRSAGAFSVLIEKASNQCRIQISSGEQRFLSTNCLATIGIVSNETFFLKKKEKAGRSRWLNSRPKVRGVAKNPIDHPHGGGEGKTSKSLNPVSPWGKPIKKGKTSRSRNKLIIR